MTQLDINKIKNINGVEEATSYLFEFIPQSEKLTLALEFASIAHSLQFRRSGEPYIVHPILVATIVASLTGDMAMVIAALLHDVVEDTEISIEVIEQNYGKDVAHLVEGLTKIDNIRDAELIPSNSDEKLIISALTFRKMLLASIEDVRVLVVKLCDRLHNMMTLDALRPDKQHRIAEETLVVYAPIAHRLGISFLKNLLEDFSFQYLFPHEKEKIDLYLEENYHATELKLNSILQKINKLFLLNGFSEDEFEIISRVKHRYSIYLKMQRKGISIDEILDLLALRIIVKNPIDAYRALGLVHLNYQPLSSRFKDYIAIPKDNGYQTLHTSVFDETAIFEVQIRTEEMHQTAELGVAAHWKYKSGGSDNVNLDWLHNLQFQNESVEDFYELIKNDLYSEDISVFSPRGKAYTLPRGALALDFAYAVHSEVGDCAQGCLINKEKASLLSELQNGDIVKIDVSHSEITRCSWIDSVKTSRAKSHMKMTCNNRINAIDSESAVNILATIMGFKSSDVEQWLIEQNCDEFSYSAARDVDRLREMVSKYLESVRGHSRFPEFFTRNRFKLKEYSFNSLEVYSNQKINDMVFDYCCHPKKGDEVVAFLENGKAHVHHKMCQNASKMMEQHRDMLFVNWKRQNSYHYHIIISMHNAKGALAEILTHLAKHGLDIMTIELGKEKAEHVKYCEIEFQSSEADINQLRGRIENKTKIISFIRTDDAYR